MLTDGPGTSLRLGARSVKDHFFAPIPYRMPARWSSGRPFLNASVEQTKTCGSVEIGSCGRRWLLRGRLPICASPLIITEIIAKACEARATAWDLTLRKLCK